MSNVPALRMLIASDIYFSGGWPEGKPSAIITDMGKKKFVEPIVAVRLGRPILLSKQAYNSLVPLIENSMAEADNMMDKFLGSRANGKR